MRFSRYDDKLWEILALEDDRMLSEALLITDYEVQGDLLLIEEVIGARTGHFAGLQAQLSEHLSWGSVKSLGPAP